jgi:hypothetical protein
MVSNFLDMFISSANLTKSFTGSDPAERTKMSGTVTEASLKDLARENVGGSMN